MSDLKERITKAVEALEKTQKAKAAAEASKRYNETVSALAKNLKEQDRQKSS